MALLQITSVAAPLNRPALLAAAIGLVRRALGLGLLSSRDRIERLDLELIRTIAREASRVGVGQDAAIALLEAKPSAPARLQSLIARLDGQLLESPIPQLEIAELLRVYDAADLAALVGTSPVSLRRYAAGTRSVPDQVAARIHFVALVTSDLAGSYNEFGVRRGWGRSRTALGGRAPREVLGGAWDPDDPAARTVAALASALAGGAGAS
jgi:hypothetical protein